MAQKISDKLKRVAFIGGILTLMGLSTPTNTISANTGNKNKNKNKNKTVNKITSNYTAQKINTLDDLHKLFDKGGAVFFSATLLAENYREAAYQDNATKIMEKTKNTIGAGSTVSPVIDEIQSTYKNPDTKWYSIAMNPKTFHAENKKLSPTDAYCLLTGHLLYKQSYQGRGGKEGNKWYTSTPDMTNMYNQQLKGVSLTPNELAIIGTIAINNPTRAMRVCEYVKKNHNDKYKCAEYIRFKSWGVNDEKKLPLWKKQRALFEAMVYLNEDNFCASLPDMRISLTSNATAIYTPLPDTQITKNNAKEITKQTKKAYLSVVYNNKNSTIKSLLDQINPNFINNNLQTTTTTMEDEIMKDFQRRFEVAKQKCRKGQLNEALQEMQQLQTDGALGASLLSEISLIYYKQERYKKSIEVGQQILTTSEYEEYPKACYNAGMSYEKLKNYERALLNYQKALEYLNKYYDQSNKFYDGYKKSYEEAITRIQITISVKKAFSQPGDTVTGQALAAIRRKDERSA